MASSLGILKSEVGSGGARGLSGVGRVSGRAGGRGREARDDPGVFRLCFRVMPLHAPSPKMEKESDAS